MPRKKNRRKEIQKAKRDAQPKKEERRLIMIDHPSVGSRGLAMAALAAGVVCNIKREK